MKLNAGFVVQELVGSARKEEYAFMLSSAMFQTSLGRPNNLTMGKRLQRTSF